MPQNRDLDNLFSRKRLLVHGSIGPSPTRGRLILTYAEQQLHLGRGQFLQVEYLGGCVPSLVLVDRTEGPITEPLEAWARFAAEHPDWVEGGGQGDVRVHLGESEAHIKPTSARLIGHLYSARALTHMRSDIYGGILSDRLTKLINSLVNKQEEVIGLFQ